MLWIAIQLRNSTMLSRPSMPILRLTAPWNITDTSSQSPYWQAPEAISVLEQVKVHRSLLMWRPQGHVGAWRESLPITRKSYRGWWYEWSRTDGVLLNIQISDVAQPGCFWRSPSLAQYLDMPSRVALNLHVGVIYAWWINPLFWEYTVECGVTISLW